MSYGGANGYSNSYGAGASNGYSGGNGYSSGGRGGGSNGYGSGLVILLRLQHLLFTHSSFPIHNFV